jgi:hypothetical protein
MTVQLWKRNAVGAVVAAAALAVHAAFISGPAWESYQRRVQPAHIAAVGQPVIVDGQTWSVRTFSRSTTQLGSGAPLPEGTVRVNVVVERSGSAADGFGCTAYLVDGDRSWRSNMGPPCGAATSMAWSFLVPASAEPQAVDIKEPDLSILLRLQL